MKSYDQSLVLCMKMIASLTSLNVDGAVMTSKLASLSDLYILTLSFRHIVTGSYSNLFRIFKRGDPNGSTYEACEDACDAPNSLLCERTIPPASGITRRRCDENADNLDYSKKILHVSWHPNSNTIALAATNNLYIFDGQPQRAPV